MIRWVIWLLLIAATKGALAIQGQTQIIDDFSDSSRHSSTVTTLPDLRGVVAKHSPFILSGAQEVGVSVSLSTCVIYGRSPQSQRSSFENIAPTHHRFELQGIVQEHGEYFAIIGLPSKQLIWVQAGDDLLHGQALVQQVNALGVAILERSDNGRCDQSWLSLSSKEESDEH
ncbi:hypothetical protein [Vibrio palustris]|uniref:Uncharacterized protein n=1 Tax=Vibrio palustris TaxID=1918946 RepID=A0A1R4B498_9VIBR|nr:hypothetical protein [Vibrio palustris]SJL83721.1 hypothetical protein VPAL9027_01699 [Vibrio palustris]